MSATPQDLLAAIQSVGAKVDALALRVQALADAQGQRHAGLSADVQTAIAAALNAQR